MDVIKSVAWLHIEDGKVLCVRTKGKDKFYIPGGKIDQGEKPQEALIREIREELNLTLCEESISPAVTIIADAHGFDNAQVEMQCYFASHTGSIAVNSEIEEIRWVGSEYLQSCAPAAQKAIEFLASQQKIFI